MHKISFCTTIKNRLHHLRITLPKNLLDNMDYKYLQFIILDYNSNDGLFEWLQTHMQSYINSGRVVYYRTNVPIFFDRSHSRNMGFKLADGHILCNIDADNFTGKGFAEYVNEAFQNDDNIFLTSGKFGSKVKPDFLGRICVKTKDFKLAGGYDEHMDGYGFEDYDLINKLRALGIKEKKVDKKSFFDAIFHSDEERISEERMMQTFHNLLINYINPNQSDLILLFNDGTFKMGTVINSYVVQPEDYRNAHCSYKTKGQYKLKDVTWKKGKWYTQADHLFLDSFHSQSKFIKKEDTFIGLQQRIYYQVSDRQVIMNIIMFCSQSSNKKKLNANISLKKKADSITQSWGKGTVYKNWDLETPLHL